MPEYLAPGVFVEEVSFRAKSIEGVSTSTAGFVGPTRYGPLTGEPLLLTSFNQFERIYGGLDQLTYPPEANLAGPAAAMHNYLAHAVRAFFDNGGRRLYVTRTYRSFADVNRARAATGEAPLDLPAGANPDGVARLTLPTPVDGLLEAEAAADGATLAATGALDAAADLATMARDAAVAMLDLALAHINAALPQDAQLLDIDTAAAPADILAAITARINGLDADARPAAEAARDEVADLINSAAAARTAAVEQQQALQAALPPLTGATAAGEAEANEVDAEDVPAVGDAGADAVAAAAAARAQEVVANNAAAAVQTAQDALVAALEALAAAGAADRLVRAGEVAAAATAASNTAGAAADAAEAAVGPITAAARAARLAVRAGEANPVGELRARFPGAMGNVRLTITTRLAQNSFSVVNNLRRLSQVKHQDLVWLNSGQNTGLFVAEFVQGDWRFVRGGTVLPLAELAANAQVRVVTWAVEVLAPGAFAQPQTWENLTAHPDRIQDGISNIFAEAILNRERELETPIVLTPVDNDPVALAAGLIGPAGLAALPAAPASGIITRLQLAGGNDGVRPTAAEYIGRGGDDDLEKSGLIAFEDLEEISIVAAPGLSFGAANGYQNEARQATQAVITHCERMRYRVAVLDSPDNLAISQVRADRAILDTTRAAYYYPWIRIQDPVTRQPIHVPPSGFIAGIYARNDVEQGVHKAPANEVVLGAIGLEVMLNTAQQEILNPLGINCVRWFENRGIRVWGARTLSSDPEWKYLNIRRYFAYLERSIERATQWAVFEPNGETLWANVRRAVEDFLYNEWASDRLAGLRPAEAFFVRCDRSTMTQNDLDNGRMICLIGVAPLYPAEFVIFRIGQWTADRRS